jgi:hypothetical protein
MSWLCEVSVVLLVLLVVEVDDVDEDESVGKGVGQ